MTSENDSGHKVSKENRRKQLEAEKQAMVYNPPILKRERPLLRKQRDKRRAEIIQKALRKFK